MKISRLSFLIALPLLAVASRLALACPSDLDTGFADGGASVGAPGADVSGNGLATLALASGDILVAGNIAGSPGVLRYDENGELDTSFGDGGVARVDLGGAFVGVAVDSLGRIVAGGYTGGGSDEVFLVARFTTLGEPDPTFGDQGYTTTAIGPSRSFIRGLAILGDGRIVAAGQSNPSSAPFYWNAIVACYDGNGDLDPGFGTEGIAILAPAAGSAIATAVVPADDDAMLISGITTNGDSLVAKLDADGNPVLDFARKGVRITRSTAYEEAWALGVDGLGRVLIAGNVGPVGPRGRTAVFVRRYLANGTKDTSYGHHGRARIRFRQDIGVRGLAVSPDGHANVPVWRSSGRRPMVARFDSDGARDRSFGTNGVVRFEFDEGAGFYAAALQDDHKLLVTGTAGGRPLLVRYEGGLWDGMEQCVIGCGNNVVSPFEECDDGNATSGDGCSAACTIE